MRKKYKQGISLVILAITIVVMIILATSTIIVTTNVIQNSQMATFSEDLMQIEAAVKAYYIDNGTFPIKGEGDTSYTLTQFEALPESTIQSDLASEVAANYDDDQYNVFYKIDLAAIDVTSTTRGNEADGDATDIYVVSKNTKTVYYVRGERIGGGTYFSTVRLNSSTKIKENKTEDSSTTSVTAITNVSANKSTSLYTKTLTLTINATLADGETLSYKFDDTDAGVATTAHDLGLTFPTNITLSGTGLTGDDLTAFNKNKKIIIEKAGGSTTQSMTVSLENLDIVPPVVGDTFNVVGYGSFNTVELTSVTDTGGSGLKELRYEYVTKTGGAPYYVKIYSEYSENNIDQSYLLDVGKKANVGLIKLPKDVKSIAVIAVDNAGNASEVQAIGDIIVSVPAT